MEHVNLPSGKTPERMAYLFLAFSREKEKQSFRTGYYCNL